jgi:hypothetical protein
LNEAITWATPLMMFFRSLRLVRVAVAGFAIYFVTFFLPAIATALPLRVRAFV